MTNRTKRFIAGFLVGTMAFAFGNLFPVPRTHPVGQHDVVEHFGFPFFFQRRGGISGVEEFHPAILVVDIALGVIFSLFLGFASARRSPTQTAEFNDSAS